jgi:SAM-dependent methyltransferase
MNKPPGYARALSSVEYLRQRQDPAPGDLAYIHLTDLRRALSRFRTEDALSVLDFGCGGSPYRDLFPNCAYHRADRPGLDDLDLEIDSDGLLPLTSSASYDLVLSTQVLEHVQSPRAYLAEAFRLIRPGGHLLLSTHGVFPDHGCPDDLWRWTADGLRVELERVGFDVRNVYRLSAGPRAIMFWLTQFGRAVVLPENRAGRILFRLLRKLYRMNAALLDRVCDRNFGRYCVTERPSEPLIDFYVGLLAYASKPDI